MERSSYLVLIAVSCFAPFSSALYDDKSDVVTLTNSNFKDKVLKSKEVWLVEFFAPWCTHCQKLAPEYSKAAAELKGTINFGAVNCDNERNLAEQLSITGYPTIKIYGLDKKSPTEYQSMRTAEALKVAALDALNELMEGKEKRKKKKEPKVVMDIDSDKASKEAGDSAQVEVETEKPKAKKESAEKQDSEPTAGVKDSERPKASESARDDSEKGSAKDEDTDSSEGSKQQDRVATRSKEQSAEKEESAEKKESKGPEKLPNETEKEPTKEKESESLEKKNDIESHSKDATADEKVIDDAPQSAEDQDTEQSLTESKSSEQQSKEDVPPAKAEEEVKDHKQSSQESEQPKEDAASSPSTVENPKSTDSAVVILTDDNFNETVIDSEEPWLVEFYAPWCKHCQKFASTYEKIAANLKGQISVGSYDCDAEETISKIYSIGSFPTLKFFPPGSKEPTDVLTYELSDLTEPAIQKWINSELSQQILAPNISQLTDQTIFDEACTSVQLCVISFLPHILDCNAACRNDYLKILKKLGDKYKKTQWGWLWVEAGAQEKLEASLDVGGAGYPAMAAVSTKKARYASLRGAFSFAGIDKFLEALYMGGESTAPIKGDLPEIKKSGAWDGKDGEMPKDDEKAYEHEEL